MLGAGLVNPSVHGCAFVCSVPIGRLLIGRAVRWLRVGWLAAVAIDTNEDEDEVAESSFDGKDSVGPSILRLIY